MRFVAYTGTSLALATGVIIRALHQRANFYSACVYLAQSNACVMILTNVALLNVSMTMLGLQRLFYGPLRPIEVEQLYEKAWFAITETCLAMTIFREEVGGWFLVMFVSLLIGKVWGWIGEGRVEVLEQQPPANPRLFHARLSISLALSTLLDVFMLWYSVKTVLQDARPNMMVMFAFEFAVLFVSSVSTTARYLISLRETAIIKSQTRDRKAQIRREREQDRTTAHGSEDQLVDAEDDVDSVDVDVPGWEEKGRWVFYLDLTTDFCKLVLYLTFFCVLCMFYGMPIHIIRDVALTIRSFHKRITDFVRYRQATRDMNARYPDATSEDFNREDCCIICREDMRAWSPPPATGTHPERDIGDNSSRTFIDERLRPKKLPCGHVLHFACLRSWLARQQNCPTCRAPVLTPVVRVQSQAQNVTNQAARGLQQTDMPRNLLQGQDNGQLPQIPAQNVLHFGPLRIAFGARNGTHGLPQQPNQQPPNVALGAGNVPRMGNHFGPLGQERGTHTRTVANFSPVTPTMQLQFIEQHLIREINTLRVQADQLHVVRALQNELTRLRLMQAYTGVPATTQSTPVNQYRQDGTARQTDNLRMSGPLFGSHSTHPGLGSGHKQLPAGVTLPEGWTLLPLQRLSDPNGEALCSMPDHTLPPDTNNAVSTPTQTLSGLSTTQDHIRSTHVTSDTAPHTVQTVKPLDASEFSNPSNGQSQISCGDSSLLPSDSDGHGSGSQHEATMTHNNGKSGSMQSGETGQTKRKGRVAAVEESTDLVD